MEYFLILLLRHLIDNGDMTDGLLAGLSDPRLGPAIVAMHQQPGRSWILDDLAHEAGMSRARFADHFRKIVGRTPIEYLTHWRMTVAQQLLQQGKPLKSVASAIGYDSPAALGRIFSKIFGQSPLAWLASDKAGHLTNADDA